MSSLLTNLVEKLQNENENGAIQEVESYFQQIPNPYEEFLNYLTKLSEKHHPNNPKLIQCLIQGFIRIQNRLRVRTFQFDQTQIDNLLVKTLSISFIDDFCNIFQISKQYLVDLLRKSLTDTTPAALYKRALNIIVRFQYQFDYKPNELILPLILNNKDHFIHLFIDNNPDIQNYVVDMLDYLYSNGGKRMRDILIYEYQMPNPNVNRKTLGRLAIRLWNSVADEKKSQYRNLINLQQTRALGYLIGIKYSSNDDERIMSDEAWNESVEVKI